MICLIELAGHGQGSIPPLHLAFTLATAALGGASILAGIWYVARGEGGTRSPAEFVRDTPLHLSREAAPR